jgi:formylglycine-generating enzyme required for sulfatase activity
MKPLWFLVPIAAIVLFALVSLEPLPASAAPTPMPKKYITNSIGMKFAYIPPGKFKMGSPKAEKERFDLEGPEHEVEITKGFYLGVYEVTQKQYKDVMGRNPSYFCKDSDGKGKVKGLDTDDFPVEYVSWHHAKEFIKKLNLLAKEKKAGRVYRLPSEAEWEYACRGGAAKKTTFHFGPSLSSTQANFDGNHPYGGAAKGKYLERTCKVGSYKANGFGLYDMHGNVWEWCEDVYDEKYYSRGPKRDPVNTKVGTVRSFRGGGWSNDGGFCRSAFRNWYDPLAQYNYLGFRIALVTAR